MSEINKVVEQIQREILDPAIPLSSILLKAKVLAYLLKNNELKTWIKNELDGYAGEVKLPDYRIIPVPSLGHFVSRFQKASNIPIPLIHLPDWLQEEARFVKLHGGIQALEQLAKSEGGANWDWPAEWLMILNRVSEENDSDMACLQARRTVSPHVFAQILQTVRSRLQDFVLEMSDLPWDMNNESPPVDQIQELVKIVILNQAQGGNVSVFDQRDQNVNYQYNAAGNINIGAVQNREELLIELEKIKAEITKAGKAKALDEGTALDVEYQLAKALQEAKKPQPNKSSFLNNIGKAKALLDDAKAAVGLIAALMQAAKLAEMFF